jgi:hypothetical protein
MATEAKPEIVQAPRVPDEVLAEIAKLAEMPVDEVEAQTICEAVAVAWDHDRLAKAAPSLAPSLERARSAAHELYDELCNLDKHEREVIERLLCDSWGRLYYRISGEGAWWKRRSSSRACSAD